MSIAHELHAPFPYCCALHAFPTDVWHQTLGMASAVATTTSPLQPSTYRQQPSSTPTTTTNFLIFPISTTMPLPLRGPPDPPPLSPAPIIPAWGCDSCGLLFKSYKRALHHCRENPAHTEEIATARESGGAIAADAAIAAILTWYHKIPDSSLREVKAAVAAAQIIDDATLSGHNNSELRRAIRKAMQTPQKEPAAKKRPRGAAEVDRVVDKPAVEVGEIASLVQGSIANAVQKQKKARRHRRHRSHSQERTPTPPACELPLPSPPPPDFLAVFRVKLQSLSEFTTADSAVKFPDAVTSHYFMFILTEDATTTPLSMLRALRIQHRRSSGVDLDWWGMVNHRWFLRATAIGREIAEMNVSDVEQFPDILPWVKRAHGRDWNWLMEIG